MSLIETLQSSEPNRGILFIAIEKLNDQKQIRNFYAEYVLFLELKGHSYLAKNNPEEAAKRNIAYILPFCDKIASDEWVKIIQE